MAHTGNRDFIHKSVHSSGQRREIRALERGNPPITKLVRKASLPYYPQIMSGAEMTAQLALKSHPTAAQTPSNSLSTAPVRGFFPSKLRFCLRCSANICFPSQLRRWTVSYRKWSLAIRADVAKSPRNRPLNNTHNSCTLYDPSDLGCFKTRKRRLQHK